MTASQALSALKANIKAYKEPTNPMDYEVYLQINGAYYALRIQTALAWTILAINAKIPVAVNPIIR